MLTPEQKQQIAEQQERQFTTKRTTVPALEAILYHPFPVLDHGFVRVVDYCGSDASIVQAARVSYGTGTKKVQEDRGLLRYLMRHQHTTPFEMCEITLHVKLPMFIARQWIRHRTANVNEYSARYSILDNEFYLPDPQNLAVQSTANRQGRDGVVDQAYAQEVLAILQGDAQQAYEHYRYLLNEEEEEGRPRLARELARMNLPVNWYTQWYWKIDLHNLLRFLNLRADSHAQYEIRAYAQTILDEIVKVWVPDVWQAFMDYRVGACYLSAQGFEVVKAWLNGQNPTQEESGMSAREWQELNAMFNK